MNATKVALTKFRTKKNKLKVIAVATYEKRLRLWRIMKTQIEMNESTFYSKEKCNSISFKLMINCIVTNFYIIIVVTRMSWLHVIDMTHISEKIKRFNIFEWKLNFHQSIYKIKTYKIFENLKILLVFEQNIVRVICYTNTLTCFYINSNTWLIFEFESWAWHAYQSSWLDVWRLLFIIRFSFHVSFLLDC